MLEFYEAYGDYNSVADLTRVLVQNACAGASAARRRHAARRHASTTSAASGTS